MTQRKISKSFDTGIFSVFLFLLSLGIQVSAQTEKPLRFVFYNVENFFDTSIDSTREYNAFTPEGEQRWTFGRYIAKRSSLFKTILAIGEGEPPAFIGFCEVENEFVLNDLIYRTPLKNLDYTVVHYESRDRRGIDVALMYRKNQLTLLGSEPIAVNDPDDPGFLTRDILFASFLIGEKDTIYTYVNHWPSRYGGQLESVEKRMLAALTLRKHVDSLVSQHPNAKIIIMGDLNDTPGDDSIINGLKAFEPSDLSEPEDLVHLFASSENHGYEGTIKHLHSWQIFDHLIITQTLFKSNSRIRYKPGSARIFAAPFMFVDDERYLGKKINRTYTGPTYLGGVSDHLPVCLDLEWIVQP
jgi:predicted extracellular nuclease